MHNLEASNVPVACAAWLRAQVPTLATKPIVTSQARTARAASHKQYSNTPSEYKNRIVYQRAALLRSDVTEGMVHVNSTSKKTEVYHQQKGHGILKEQCAAFLCRTVALLSSRVFDTRWS